MALVAVLDPESQDAPFSVYVSTRSQSRRRLASRGTSRVYGRLVAADQNAVPKTRCPQLGTEVPFAKVMNAAFAPDYVGCDITTKVEFVDAASTPAFFDRVKGTAGKASFRVVTPGQQTNISMV